MPTDAMTVEMWIRCGLQLSEGAGLLSYQAWSENGAVYGENELILFVFGTQPQRLKIYIRAQCGFAPCESHGRRSQRAFLQHQW